MTVRLTYDDARNLFELAILTEDRTDEEQVAINHLAIELDREAQQ